MHTPAHPGELVRETIEGIREETGERLPLEEVAKGLGTTRKTLSAIINGGQSVTPEMAIKQAAGLGSTPELWLRAQENRENTSSTFLIFRMSLNEINKRGRI